jgi:uncharacterized membrane protein (GlpM family)
MQERLFPVVVSVVVIILVAVVQERSRYLAAVLASMPLTAPLALWIVFSATKGDHQQTANFAAAMVVGFIGSLAFIVGRAAVRAHRRAPARAARLGHPASSS